MLSLSTDVFNAIAMCLSHEAIDTLATSCTSIRDRCEGVWVLKLEQRLGYHVPNADRETYKKYIRSGTPHIIDKDKQPVIINEKLQQRRDVVKVCADYVSVAILTVEGECFVFDEEHIYTATGVTDFLLCSAGKHGVVIALQREDRVDVVVLDEHKELTAIRYEGDLVESTRNHVVSVFCGYLLMKQTDVVEWWEKTARLRPDGRLMCDDEVLAENVLSLWPNIGDGPFLCYITEPR
jgi:hypothetical protein